MGDEKVKNLKVKEFVSDVSSLVNLDEKKRALAIALVAAKQADEDMPKRKPH